MAAALGSDKVCNLGPAASEDKFGQLERRRATSTCLKVLTPMKAFYLLILLLLPMPGFADPHFGRVIGSAFLRGAVSGLNKKIPSHPGNAVVQYLKKRENQERRMYKASQRRPSEIRGYPERRKEQMEMDQTPGWDDIYPRAAVERKIVGDFNCVDKPYGTVCE